MGETFVRDSRELRVWQKAYRLTLDVYKVTWKFLKEELYNLTSKTRRSAAWIAANIAEGCGRTGALELHRFFQIAMGSASELEFHHLSAHDLGLLVPTDFERLSQQVVEVKKMLTFISRTLKMNS